MIDNSNSTPINKTAALVIGKGVNYDCPKKVQTVESKNVLPLRPALFSDLNKNGFIDCTGLSIGRLKVLGIYKNGGGWVCRCVCGTYCVRRQKAILNKNNTQDRCEECRHLAYLKRDEYRRRTGKDKDINDF